ncbi:MAG: hypothetical protein ACPK7O_07570 [Methanobacterium sp.]
MPRNNLRELTLDIIQDNELPKRKILEEVRSKSGKSVSDKTLNEILMSLLRDGEIYITGYDFDVYRGMKRIQSIKADGIIFGQMKTNPLEISILISQLESDDPLKVKDASNKLKIIFRSKVDELKNNDLNSEVEIKNVNFLFNKIVYYINCQVNDQKNVLINKLAWSLSNEEGSTGLLKNLINYIESQK